MPWLAGAAGGTAGAAGGTAAAGAGAAGAGAVGASGLGIGGATSAGLGATGGLGIGGAGSAATTLGSFGSGIAPIGSGASGVGAVGGYGAGAGLSGANVLSGAVGAGGIGGGSQSLALGAFPNLSQGLAGGGWNLGALGEGLGVASGLKSAADYAQSGVKKAMNKIPTAKTVTGNAMLDGRVFGGVGHGAQEAANEGMKILASKAQPSLGIDFSKAFAAPDVAGINATPGWTDTLRTGMAQAQDWAKNNPKTADFAQNIGQQILSPPGGQGAPATGAPNVQYNQGQMRGQSAEDQMNALLMQLFQGRQ